WIETCPLLDEILDDLHAAGRLPEQRDYLAWRREVVALFDQPNNSAHLVWHQPNGRSERVTVRPLPMGGLAFLFDDITKQLEWRSAYNMLVKVQEATLDRLDEAIAVFGPDGKLRLRNKAFLQLWRFEDGE